MLTHSEQLDAYAAEASAITADILRRAVRIVGDQLLVVHEVAPALRPATAEQIEELTAKRYPELVAAAVDAQARIYAASILAEGRR